MYEFHEKNWVMRHKALLIIWALVLGIGGYSAYVLFLKPTGSENPYVLSNSSSRQSDDKDTSDQDETKSATAKLGQQFTDHGLEVTISGVKCGEETMGTNEYAHDDAVGVFCRISATIKNTIEDSANVRAAKMFAYDATGKEYPFDVPATLYAQESMSAGVWYESIEPNDSASGDFVFDLPVGITPTKVLFVGAEDSKGVEVSLQ